MNDLAYLLKSVAGYFADIATFPLRYAKQNPRVILWGIVCYIVAYFCGYFALVIRIEDYFSLFTSIFWCWSVWRMSREAKSGFGECFWVLPGFAFAFPIVIAWLFPDIAYYVYGFYYRP